VTQETLLLGVEQPWFNVIYRELLQELQTRGVTFSRTPKAFVVWCLFKCRDAFGNTFTTYLWPL